MAIMSPGVSIRTAFLPVLIAPKILRGSVPRGDGMVRYTASEGLAHHFAVESDELRLKTNVCSGPLSVQSRRRRPGWGGELFRESLLHRVAALEGRGFI